MFHIEQAMQLMIKAKFLDEKGHFERTCSLKKLLSEFKYENIKKFVEKYIKVLRNLERAYMTSRHYLKNSLKMKLSKRLKR